MMKNLVKFIFKNGLQIVEEALSIEDDLSRVRGDPKEDNRIIMSILDYIVDIELEKRQHDNLVDFITLYKQVHVPRTPKGILMSI